MRIPAFAMDWKLISQDFESVMLEGICGEDGGDSVTLIVRRKGFGPERYELDYWLTGKPCFANIYRGNSAVECRHHLTKLRAFRSANRAVDRIEFVPADGCDDFDEVDIADVYASR